MKWMGGAKRSRTGETRAGLYRAPRGVPRRRTTCISLLLDSAPRSRCVTWLNVCVALTGGPQEDPDQHRAKGHGRENEP
jgi:hypothetical protein